MCYLFSMLLLLQIWFVNLDPVRGLLRFILNQQCIQWHTVQHRSDKISPNMPFTGYLCMNYGKCFGQRLFSCCLHLYIQRQRFDNWEESPRIRLKWTPDRGILKFLIFYYRALFSKFQSTLLFSFGHPSSFNNYPHYLCHDTGYFSSHSWRYWFPNIFSRLWWYTWAWYYIYPWWLLLSYCIWYSGKIIVCFTIATLVHNFFQKKFYGS